LQLYTQELYTLVVGTLLHFHTTKHDAKLKLWLVALHVSHTRVMEAAMESRHSAVSVKVWLVASLQVALEKCHTVRNYRVKNRLGRELQQCKICKKKKRLHFWTFKNENLF